MASRTCWRCGEPAAADQQTPICSKCLGAVRERIERREHRRTPLRSHRRPGTDDIRRRAAKNAKVAEPGLIRPPSITPWWED